MKEAIRRNETVAVRLRKHERRQIEDAAAASLTSLTEFVRGAVLARARHVLKQQNTEARSSWR